MASVHTINALTLTAFVLVLSSPAVSYADSGLLRTIHTMDDARGYCLDIPGEGQTLRLDAALQLHTCKYGGPLDDQRFERTTAGSIRASRYDRCLEAASLQPGAQLRLGPCGSAPAQLWSMAWGRVSPASRPDLCLSAATTDYTCRHNSQPVAPVKLYNPGTGSPSRRPRHRSTDAPRNGRAVHLPTPQ